MWCWRSYDFKSRNTWLDSSMWNFDLLSLLWFWICHLFHDLGTAYNFAILRINFFIYSIGCIVFDITNRFFSEYHDLIRKLLHVCDSCNFLSCSLYKIQILIKYLMYVKYLMFVSDIESRWILATKLFVYLLSAISYVMSRVSWTCSTCL